MHSDQLVTSSKALQNRSPNACLVISDPGIGKMKMARFDALYGALRSVFRLLLYIKLFYERNERNACVGRGNARNDFEQRSDQANREALERVSARNRESQGARKRRRNRD